MLFIDKEDFTKFITAKLGEASREEIRSGKEYFSGRRTGIQTVYEYFLEVDGNQFATDRAEMARILLEEDK